MPFPKMYCTTEIYFFWFLICSAAAKHMQMPETSTHSQRSSIITSTYPSILVPKHSSVFPTDSVPVEDVQISFLPPSYYNLRGSLSNPYRLRHYTNNVQNSESSQYTTDSDRSLRRSERTLRDLSEHFTSNNHNYRLSDSELVKRQINNVSANVTQSNETNIDDPSDGVNSSGHNRSDDLDAVDGNSSSSSSTVTSVDSNSIQKSLNGDDGVRLDDSRSLKRVFLTNRSIVCNDGSQAGFYLRRSMSGSPVWVVFLEGGWYCHDRASCRARWMRLRHLMTSSHWPETRDINGILSPHPSENPYWHDANHVSVPYCSSDTWSGAAPPSSAPDSFKFMGKLIVNQVIRDLVPLGLQNSSWLILAGSSAGGTGVMLNLDPVQRLLKDELGLKKVAVRGISDSGWFLDRTPYSPNTLPAVDAIKKGYELWHGSLPKKCVALYPQEPWRCYFGYRLYPTIKAPLFVFQWLFDEAQMTADNVGAPVTPQQWDYIHSMGRALRESFANVSAVFAPSCVSHSVLTKRDWLQVKIDDVSVAQALRCWELFTMKKHSRRNSLQPARRLVKSGMSIISDGRPDAIGPADRHQNRRRKRKKHSHDDLGIVAAITASENHHKKVSDVSSERIMIEPRHPNSNNRHRNNRNRHRNNYHNNRRNNNPNNRNRQNHRNNKNNQQNSPNCSRLHKLNSNNRHYQNMKCETFANMRRHGKKNRLGGRRNHHHNETTDREINTPGHRMRSERLRMERSLMRNSASGGCEHRHLERCSWPQCSHSCPRLLDPYTGEEVQFIDMLKSFGLRMDSVAQALGVDLHTLNNMDHAELLDLLTQQIN